MENLHFPLLTNTTYLNTAYVGLMSTELANFRAEHEAFYLSQGGDHYKMNAYDKLTEVHQNFASFFGLAAERCFGVSSFSSGIRDSLSFLPDNMKVLQIEEDYPSLSNAFKERNFFCSTIPMQPQLEDAIERQLEKGETDILALSIIQYTTGLLIYFDFLKRMKLLYPNLIIVGDGTQFLGAHEFEFDNSPFDLVVASGYKWLLAGFGNGIVMISSSFLNRAQLSSTAMRERFFQGHFNILGMASLNFAIDSLQKLNFPSLIQKKTDLGLKAKIRLTEEGYIPKWVSERSEHSTIFSLRGGEELHKRLEKENIRTVLRGSGLRVSFHWYNTDQDLDHLISTLQKFRS